MKREENLKILYVRVVNGPVSMDWRVTGLIHLYKVKSSPQEQLRSGCINLFSVVGEAYARGLIDCIGVSIEVEIEEEQ